MKFAITVGIKNKIMKTIKNPSLGKLGIALIPIPIMLIYIIATHSRPLWTIIVMIASTVVYMALVTYFCIRQKCYRQLALGWFILISWVIVFVIQFCYIDKLFDNLPNWGRLSRFRNIVAQSATSKSPTTVLNSRTLRIMPRCSTWIACILHVDGVQFFIRIPVAAAQFLRERAAA